MTRANYSFVTWTLIGDTHIQANSVHGDPPHRYQYIWMNPGLKITVDRKFKLPPPYR